MKDLKVLIVDHFDSFTYNLCQLLSELGAVVEVLRSDVPFSTMVSSRPTHVVLSPGPGHPIDVPVYRQALDHWGMSLPILGVCLGHQAIGLALGGVVKRNWRQMHGKTSRLRHDSSMLFWHIPNQSQVMRYHSLAVEEASGAQFKVTAWCEEGQEREVMGLRSTIHPFVWGVQFHPESYYTPGGRELLKNFLAMSVAARQ